MDLQVGDRVSFFVIAGNKTDEIYAGYRLLTGSTPMLPKAAYGFIQCKQRYSTQDEVLAVLKATASGTCRPMSLWWIGFTTPRWDRWIWSLPIGLIRWR